MTNTQRFAAIDCGTNSIRLLISQVDANGQLTELNRDNIIVRLGQGVDATGKFADEALQRVDDALRIYADRMVEYGVVDVMMGATSATRDAANRDVFFDLTRRHLGRVREGAAAEVISGEQEARLSFRGAVMDLAAASGASESAGADAGAASATKEFSTTCVIDLGGGSTEFVVGGEEAYSADMGCVRLTERHLKTVPPTDAEVSAARADVQDLLNVVESHVGLTKVTRVVGVAGTMTTLCALAQGLDSYQPEKIHMHTLPLARLREVAVNLVPLTPEQRMEFGPMHPGRADVIGGGALVVEAFTKRFEELGLTDITISEKDILDGILAEVIDRNS